MDSLSGDCKLFLELLAKTGLARLRVVGNSMSPSLRTGDTILVRDLGRAPVKVGQLVTFLQGEILCTHRIVKLCGTKLITCGDANLRADLPIERRQCVASVIAVERGNRILPVAAVAPTSSLWKRFSRIGRSFYFKLALIAHDRRLGASVTTQSS